jgi:hypothetical protein
VRGTVRDGAGAVPLFAVADLSDVVVHLAGRAHVLNEIMADPLGSFGG